MVTGWSDASFRLEFRHRVRDEQSWKNGTVTFRTVLPRNADGDYRDRCHEVFTDHPDDLQTAARSTPIVIEGQSRTLTEATYSFDPFDSPAGYYEALAGAFEDHLVLVPLLTDIYEQAFREFV